MRTERATQMGRIAVPPNNNNIDNENNAAAAPPAPPPAATATANGTTTTSAKRGKRALVTMNRNRKTTQVKHRVRSRIAYTSISPASAINSNLWQRCHVLYLVSAFSSLNSFRRIKNSFSQILLIIAGTFALAWLPYHCYMIGERKKHSVSRTKQLHVSAMSQKLRTRKKHAEQRAISKIIQFEPFERSCQNW